MRNKKETQGDQPYSLTTNPTQPSNDPHKILNDMYQRIKCKTNQDKKQATTDSNIVLLSYLSKSQQESNQNNQTIQKLKDSLQRAHLHHHAQIDGPASSKIKREKKYSQKQRIKTQFDQMDSVSEVQFLRRENQMLKNKLNKCQKRVIYLQPFQGEVQYLKKIVFIQNIQIQKLRTAVKNAKRSQLQHAQQQNKLTQCVSMGLKQVKNRNEPILISDQSQMTENEQKIYKKKKCSHKGKAQPITQHIRTQSRIEVGSNSKNKSFHSKQRQEIGRKIKKEKNICR